MDFKYLKERIKGVHNDWARDRRELMAKVRLTFQEATLTHQLDELRSENVQRQKQLCQALYEKVRNLRIFLVASSVGWSYCIITLTFPETVSQSLEELAVQK